MASNLWYMVLTPVLLHQSIHSVIVRLVRNCWWNPLSLHDPHKPDNPWSLIHTAVSMVSVIVWLVRNCWWNPLSLHDPHNPDNPRSLIVDPYSFLSDQVFAMFMSLYSTLLKLGYTYIMAVCLLVMSMQWASSSFVVESICLINKDLDSRVYHIYIEYHASGLYSNYINTRHCTCCTCDGVMVSVTAFCSRVLMSISASLL